MYVLRLNIIFAKCARKSAFSNTLTYQASPNVFGKMNDTVYAQQYIYCL